MQFIGSCTITGIDKVKVKYNEMELNRQDKKISENNADKTIDLPKIPELINKFDFFFWPDSLTTVSPGRDLKINSEELVCDCVYCNLINLLK